MKPTSFVIQRSHNQGNNGVYHMSTHARERMHERGYSHGLIVTVLTYGRIEYRRGSMLFMVGRKEVEKYKPVCIREAHGIHVAVDVSKNLITTIFRNKDFRNAMIADRPKWKYNLERKKKSRKRDKRRGGPQSFLTSTKRIRRMSKLITYIGAK